MNDESFVDFAPVVLFVHSRPTHTLKTIEALAANSGAECTDLYIFSDAGRSVEEQAEVAQVRKIANEAKGFKSVNVIEQDKNLGLADSIISGVSKVVNERGRVIVLEDDIVTSEKFLTFMNCALEKYSKETEVWHINGWNYPTEIVNSPKAFFTPVMACWGWATWSDRWAKFERNPEALLNKFNKLGPDVIDKFNVSGGYNYFYDIRRNASCSVKTWAVFWYATIFLNAGLCLTPPRSFTKNIGIDGSGVNSGSRDIYASDMALPSDLPDWPSLIAADLDAWNNIKRFLLSSRPWFGRRLGSRIKWGLRGLVAKTLGWLNDV